MDSTCTEIGGHRRGFHTFVMTGDAIIRTNYNTNPLKPSRQLSLDSNTQPKERMIADRCTSHEGTTTKSKPDSDNNNKDNIETERESIANSPHSCSQSREFIPGFIRVEEGIDGQSVTRTPVHTEDSGIDVHLSDDTEEEPNAQPCKDNNSIDNRAETDILPSNTTEAVGTYADEPSVKHLATRLYQLDGFRLSDVCYYLSKSDEFTEKVVAEFLNFFDFTGHSLVESLRAFLCQTSLEATLEDKEKILLHFTRRYLHCNQHTHITQTFHSEDSCHTLVCALVLLNNDLHCPLETNDAKTTRKLFIENLSQLNGGQDFPKHLLTSSYHDVKGQPLVTPGRGEELKRRLSDAVNYGVEPLDADSKSHIQDIKGKRRCYPAEVTTHSSTISPHMLSHTESMSQLKDAELMKGYILKKHCTGPKGVKTPSGKRGWKRHYGILKDLKLMLLKSDKRTQNHHVDKFIDLDNAFSAVATHYTKRKNAFSVTTADGSEYLFVARSKDTMEEWIYSINLTAASYSRQQENTNEVSGNQERLSSSHFAPLGTPRRMREQLRFYESQVRETGNLLLHNVNDLPQKGATKRQVQTFTANQYQQQLCLQKYTVYMNIFRAHLDRFKPRGDSAIKSIPAERVEHHTDSLYVAGCRMSYRLAVYGK